MKPLVWALRLRKNEAQKGYSKARSVCMKSLYQGKLKFIVTSIHFRLVFRLKKAPSLAM